MAYKARKDRDCDMQTSPGTNSWEQVPQNGRAKTAGIKD